MPMKKPLLKSRTNWTTIALTVAASVGVRTLLVKTGIDLSGHETEVAVLIAGVVGSLGLWFRQLAGESTVDQQAVITPRP